MDQQPISAPRNNQITRGKCKNHSTRLNFRKDFLEKIPNAQEFKANINK